MIIHYTSLCIRISRPMRSTGVTSGGSTGPSRSWSRQQSSVAPTAARSAASSTKTSCRRLWSSMVSLVHLKLQQIISGRGGHSAWHTTWINCNCMRHKFKEKAPPGRISQNLQWNFFPCFRLSVSSTLNLTQPNPTQPNRTKPQLWSQIKINQNWTLRYGAMIAQAIKKLKFQLYLTLTFCC